MGDERKSIQPDYGRRLLVHVIDERARDGHPRPWASIPVDRYSVEGGYRDISYSLLSSAINRCAHWLKATISRSVEYEPVAYIGPHDIRYHIVMLAASKSGHVVSSFQYSDALLLLYAEAALSTRCSFPRQETVSRLSFIYWKLATYVT